MSSLVLLLMLMVYLKKKKPEQAVTELADQYFRKLPPMPDDCKFAPHVPIKENLLKLKNASFFERLAANAVRPIC